MDLAIEALKEIEVNIKGQIADLSKRQQFDLSLEIPPFSPRKALAALGQAFPIQTADPKALDVVSVKAMLKGNPQGVAISGGALDLDDSKLTFSFQGKEFAKPILSFDVNLDQIDVDRYLPPPGEQPTAKETAKPESASKKADYTPLRRLVVDGTIKVGKLKAHGARIQDLAVKISGKNGRIHLDPMTLKLYEGEATARGALDVQQSAPKTSIELDAKGIQIEPLLKDMMEKDFLAGMTQARINISMTGDEAGQIKQTLNGKGDVLFSDGAINGIDLPGMVRNAKAAFGLAEKGGERPKTDFSELHAPFTITNGIVNTPGATLMSPLLRVAASGDADLVKEELDFRVEPKFVATLKGQQDEAQRSGVMVPVLVTGSFSSPKFRPDLKGLLKKKLEEGLPKPAELEKLLPGQKTDEGGSESLEEKAKGLIKGLPLGGQQ
jgi:AsmA protein